MPELESVAIGLVVVFGSCLVALLAIAFIVMGVDHD